MAKPASFNKREIEKKKASKRLEKQKKKEERKSGGGSGLDDMIAYVDENGVIMDTPPDPAAREEVDIESIEISTPKKEESDEDTILKGRVEYFTQSKGYGFIREDGSGEKYFFHISVAPEGIAEGNKVTFALERGPRGMNAVNIVKI